MAARLLALLTFALLCRSSASGAPVPSPCRFQEIGCAESPSGRLFFVDRKAVDCDSFCKALGAAIRCSPRASPEAEEKRRLVEEHCHGGSSSGLRSPPVGCIYLRGKSWFPLTHVRGPLHGGTPPMTFFLFLFFSLLRRVAPPEPRERVSAAAIRTKPGFSRAPRKASAGGCGAHKGFLFDSGEDGHGFVLVPPPVLCSDVPLLLREEEGGAREFLQGTESAVEYVGHFNSRHLLFFSLLNYLRS